MYGIKLNIHILRFKVLLTVNGKWQVIGGKWQVIGGKW